MVDHNQQKLTAREMVRAHTYPLLAAVSSLSLLSITALLIPQAVKTHRYNRCIDVQIATGQHQSQGRHSCRQDELPQSRRTLRRLLNR